MHVVCSVSAEFSHKFQLQSNEPIIRMFTVRRFVSIVCLCILIFHFFMCQTLYIPIYRNFLMTHAGLIECPIKYCKVYLLPITFLFLIMFVSPRMFVQS